MEYMESKTQDALEASMKNESCNRLQEIIDNITTRPMIECATAWCAFFEQAKGNDKIARLAIYSLL